MFVTGGENVFPQEVEALLERHPDVRQAAVLPVAHAVKGTVPAAFVAGEAGQRPDEADLRRFALRHGPAYAYPRRVLVVGRLPLTGTNKIDKAALRAMLQGAEEEAAGA
jgi:long-chain acyl-CoA synthetase